MLSSSSTAPANDSPHGLSDELHKQEHHASAIKAGVELWDILQVEVHVTRRAFPDHLHEKT